MGKEVFDLKRACKANKMTTRVATSSATRHTRLHINQVSPATPITVTSTHLHLHLRPACTGYHRNHSCSFRGLRCGDVLAEKNVHP